jgi:hypothetical protein
MWYGLNRCMRPSQYRTQSNLPNCFAGDLVELCDGRGGVVQCEVAATSKSSAMVRTLHYTLLMHPEAQYCGPTCWS